jgi:hypothetical protein
LVELKRDDPSGLAGDPLAAAALANMLPSARDKCIREHFAGGYRNELRRLAELGIAGPEEEE